MMISSFDAWLIIYFAEIKITLSPLKVKENFRGKKAPSR